MEALPRLQNNEEYQELLAALVVLPTLKETWNHPRDDEIEFEPECHRYRVKSDMGSKYESVTGWYGQQFRHETSDDIVEKMFKGKKWGPSHKYWGQSKEEILASWSIINKEACRMGELHHKAIEAFINYSTEAGNDGKKKLKTHAELSILWMIKEQLELEQKVYEILGKGWRFFLQFVCNNPTLVPLRTEWRIYHEELKICGTIDAVYLEPDGSLVIIDWKRAKDIKHYETIESFRRYATTVGLGHVPDLKYWHYALQLNCYRHILESKYAQRVSNMVLVVLHPEGDSYKLMMVPRMEKEIEVMVRDHMSFLNQKSAPEQAI